jgi:hypothetical protein
LTSEEIEEMKSKFEAAHTGAHRGQFRVLDDQVVYRPRFPILYVAVLLALLAAVSILLWK